MILDVTSQLNGFLGGLLVGFLLGLLYDSIRPFKVSLHPYLQEFLDFLYCFFVLVILIYFAPSLSYGYLRISLLMSYALGFFLYFKLLSPLFRSLSTAWERAENWIISVLGKPFYKIHKKYTDAWNKYLKLRVKTIKKFFSFPPFWFKISKIPKRLGVCTQKTRKSEGAQEHDEEQAWKSY